MESDFITDDTPELAEANARQLYDMGKIALYGIRMMTEHGQSVVFPGVDAQAPRLNVFARPYIKIIDRSTNRDLENFAAYNRTILDLLLGDESNAEAFAKLFKTDPFDHDRRD